MRLAERFRTMCGSGYLVLAAWVIAMSPSVSFAEEAEPLPGQRVILVTGSTGGLGRETALALASRRSKRTALAA